MYAVWLRFVVNAASRLGSASSFRVPPWDIAVRIWMSYTGGVERDEP